MYQTYIGALRDKDFLELFMILVSSSQYRCGNQQTRNLEMGIQLCGISFSLLTRQARVQSRHPWMHLPQLITKSRSRPTSRTTTPTNWAGSLPTQPFSQPSL